MHDVTNSPFVHDITGFLVLEFLINFAPKWCGSQWNPLERVTPPPAPVRGGRGEGTFSHHTGVGGLAIAGSGHILRRFGLVTLYIFRKYKGPRSVRFFRSKSTFMFPT